jgi:predicted RNase H-like HicB family nuclease
LCHTSSFTVNGARARRGETAILLNMFKVEIEQEGDGRWIAEVPELPGVLAYGASREQAVTRAQALSLRVLAERLEHGEDIPKWTLEP